MALDANEFCGLRGFQCETMSEQFAMSREQLLPLRVNEALLYLIGINNVDNPFSWGERTIDNAKLGIVTIMLIGFNEEKIKGSSL